MPEFSGVNHVAFTVRDLDVSERFYCGVLGFMVILVVGTARVCMHRPTGFTIALLHPDGANDDAFTPLRTGLDHLGFTATSRADLEEWERRLLAADVSYSPIQDMPLGHHLNFTDPDGIALEFQAPQRHLPGGPRAAQGHVGLGRRGAAPWRRAARVARRGRRRLTVSRGRWPGSRRRSSGPSP